MFIFFFKLQSHVLLVALYEVITQYKVKRTKFNKSRRNDLIKIKHFQKPLGREDTIPIT